jgi:hypothetical protein
MWGRLYTYYRAKYSTQNVVVFICLEGHGDEILFSDFSINEIYCISKYLIHCRMIDL